MHNIHLERMIHLKGVMLVFPVGRKPTGCKTLPGICGFYVLCQTGRHDKQGLVWMLAEYQSHPK
jgi:hypothetical protein